MNNTKVESSSVEEAVGSQANSFFSTDPATAIAPVATQSEQQRDPHSLSAKDENNKAASTKLVSPLSDFFKATLATTVNTSRAPIPDWVKDSMQAGENMRDSATYNSLFEIAQIPSKKV